ncbi:MAG: MlaD family protein [Candidatus Dormibacteria bacterium]|jgi:phospholipid/cholesterol/gamma-HCH transport system substrate-binding protein
MIVRVARLVASSKGLFVAALATGAFCGLALSLGGAEHTAAAQFTNVNGLTKGNEVRIGGIEVGTVQSLEVHVDPQSGAETAQVVFSVDNAHWPLRNGTRVAVRPKGVLSNVYIDVTPGSASARSLGDSPAFGLGLTSSPVNLDELSNIFDPSVRTSIRTQLQEGVLAFGGAGIPDLNQTIANTNPLSADAVPITGVLAARSPQLDRLNGEFDTISADLAREDKSLRGLITNGNVVLGTLATHEVSLQGTLVHAAGTLGTLDQALQGEESNLTKIFNDGPNALNRAKSAADLLAPLIANVDPFIGDLDVLLHEFVTATGYNTGTGSNAYGLPLDTLRVDGSLPLPGKSAKPCGGTWENPC